MLSFKSKQLRNLIVLVLVSHCLYTNLLAVEDEDAAERGELVKDDETKKNFPRHDTSEVWNYNRTIFIVSLIAILSVLTP